MDISAAAIGEAVTLVDREFPDKRPRLFVNDDLRFQELESNSVDVALAQSVLTHLPPALVDECLQHIGRVLETDGRFFATFHKAKEYHAVPALRLGSDSMRYPFADLERMAREAGLEAEEIPYPEHPSDEMHMAVFR
jgi:SAM-dependent methyltransferase